ncbi:hypothetical protein FXO38_21094 [Capsicum annuum]|nr:hypothetical protein FXO38_21094 [Capsicum annuum]
MSRTEVFPALPGFAYTQFELLSRPEPGPWPWDSFLSWGVTYTSLMDSASSLRFAPTEWDLPTLRTEVCPALPGFSYTQFELLSRPESGPCPRWASRNIKD